MATTGVSITPAPAIAPIAPLAARPSVAPSPGPGTPGSVTSKEWVIPPRPKPGRKPATDTPPTKRKAQNRAAQRAFRERRAQRVQELEEQMKDVEDGHDAQVATLNEQIGSLSQEIEQCREETSWWRNRCHALEKEVSIERSAKEAIVKEFRSSVSCTSTKSSIMPDSVPLPPRTRPSTRSSRMDGIISTQPEHAQEENEETNPLGCGDCSSEHCQCIEDAFGTPVDTHESTRAKYPPHGVGSPRRGGAEPEIKPDPEEMEIDFTSRFAAVPQASANNNASNNNTSSPPVDPCGFCQDGTPCICAEMAAQEQQRGRRNSFENNRLAPIQSISQFTPPPSESDARSEVTLPSIGQATNPCANGPGTCAQCVADPRSTLFCKTLAASRSASGAPSGGGCCGGKGADGGCCMSRNASSAPSTRKNPSMPPQFAVSKPSSPSALTLSCADAFTTLSRHPNFSRASDEISTWLPKLHTLPNPRELGLAEKPGPMEVEAASVMGVLRYFDRRFAEN